MRTDRKPRAIPYEDVATIVTEHPTRYAPLMTERWGIPTTTAHRWVYQARLRGYLPKNPDRPCPTCGGTGRRQYGRRRR